MITPRRFTREQTNAIAAQERMAAETKAQMTIVCLREDNRQLRALVDHLCGEIKKIAAELGKLIDKDIH